MKTAEKASHTPGPWETKPETDYVPAQVWADGRQLAEVYGEDRATRAINARLMAAAPELLEACEIALWIRDRIADVSRNVGLTLEEWDQIEAAIRKAKGVPFNCPQCGLPLSTTQKFCERCGTACPPFDPAIAPLHSRKVPA